MNVGSRLKCSGSVSKLVGPVKAMGEPDGMKMRGKCEEMEEIEAVEENARNGGTYSSGTVGTCEYCKSRTRYMAMLDRTDQSGGASTVPVTFHPLASCKTVILAKKR